METEVLMLWFGIVVQPHLSSISVILCLVYVQQTGQAEVRDLHVVWVLHQNVAGGQISVDQPNVLQIIHPLHQHRDPSGWSRNKGRGRKN